MDYKKKYEESLALMADCIIDEDGYVHVRPQDIFPELAKSEDDRIRKALVDALNKNLGNGIEKYGTTLNAALAWLEKQRQPRMQYGITINGVEYELIKDDETAECERCALSELCYSMEDLCNALHSTNVSVRNRFEKR